ncbi:hypothetical protein IKG28_01700 [Candidatus Saccharibacteria bacterium]|nr:hypothetical protein [Candidatus Saccharibacteria bacterium]
MKIENKDMAVSIISASGQAFEKMLEEAGVAIRAHYERSEEGFYMARFLDYSVLAEMSGEQFVKLLAQDEMPDFVPRITIMCHIGGEEVVIVKQCDRFESEEHLQIVNETDVTRLKNGELFTMLRERRPSLLNI